MHDLDLEGGNEYFKHKQTGLGLFKFPEWVWNLEVPLQLGEVKCIMVCWNTSLRISEVP